MLIIYIIFIGAVVGYATSLRKAKFPIAVYLSVAFLGAVVGAFLSFGDAPLYPKYPALNIWTVPAVFSIVFAFIAMLADKRGVKIAVLPALVVMAIISGFIFLDSKPSDLSGLFREKLTLGGVERVGQPIEGFDAPTLKRAFPGFINEDFEGVRTLGGHYKISEGSLVYVRDQGVPVTSAGQAITAAGYRTLLENVSLRLEIEAGDETSVNMLLEKLSEETSTEAFTE